MPTKFENLAENPLEGVMVSYSRRIKYTDINLLRMEKNNPSGVYDTLIADTQLKRDAFAGNLSTSKMNEAIRIAYTSELSSTASEFISTTSRAEGLIKSVFGKDSPVYKMFFPFGLTAFHTANQGEMPIMMDNIISLLLTYETDLGSLDYHDKFVDIKDRYINANTLQKQAAGIVVNSSAVKQILWNDLKKQLYKNMLSLVLNNIDNPKLMLTYFVPSLLRFHHKKDDGSNNATLKVLVPPSTTMDSGISFSPDDTILLMNNSNDPIYYFGATTADATPPDSPSEILGGEEAEVKALILGAPGKKFLLLQNKSTTETIEVEIALI